MGRRRRRGGGGGAEVGGRRRSVEKEGEDHFRRGSTPWIKNLDARPPGCTFEQRSQCRPQPPRPSAPICAHLRLSTLIRAYPRSSAPINAYPRPSFTSVTNLSGSCPVAEGMDPANAAGGSVRRSSRAGALLATLADALHARHLAVAVHIRGAAHLTSTATTAARPGVVALSNGVES